MKLNLILLSDEHPNLVLLSATHKVGSTQTDQIPIVVINLFTEEIYLEKCYIPGFLEEPNIINENLTTQTVYETTFQERAKDKCFGCYNK